APVGGRPLRLAPLGAVRRSGPPRVAARAAAPVLRHVRRAALGGAARAATGPALVPDAAAPRLRRRHVARLALPVAGLPFGDALVLPPPARARARAPGRG